ncbi:MAG: glycosyltransferase [Chloroflexi bacterium]|nr:glycosyltransferase [Chloroflexota bacterium]
MRLALIMPGFSANEDDWAIPVLQSLVRELGQRHDVHEFSLRYPFQAGIYKVHGATVHAIGGATRRGMRRFGLLRKAAQAIGLQADHSPFDVIHGFWTDEAGAVAVYTGRRMCTSTVASVMGGELVGFADIQYGGQLSRIGRRLSAWALPRADAVTVGSHYLRIIREADFMVRRLEVIPLGGGYKPIQYA